MEKDGNGASTDVSSDPAQVDLSSDVVISIDRASVRQRASVLSEGSASRALVVEYQALTQTVEAGEKLVQAHAAWVAAGSRDDQRADLQKAMKAANLGLLSVMKFLTGAAQPTPEAEQRRQALTATMNTALQATASVGGQVKRVVDQLLAIHMVAATELVNVQKALDEALAKDGVTFQLGAWLSGSGAVRPLHVPGFDSYPPGTRVDLARFKVSFSEETQQQFKNAQDVAKSFNSDGAAATTLKALQPTLDAAVAPLREAAQEVRTAIQAFTTAKPSAAPAVAALLASVNAFDAVFNASAAKISKGLASGQASAALADPKSDLDLLATAARNVGTAAVDVIKQLGSPAAGTPEAALVGTLRSVPQHLQADFEAQLTDVFAAINGFFTISDDAARTMTFGEQVTKLSADSLPAEATVSLPNAGARNPGDLVIIEFAIAKTTGIADSETRTLALRWILTHVETTAGLIFAQQPRGPNVTSRVQAGASYSVLLKWGYRNSPFWDTFFRPGIGVNVAALDFSHNGTPQFGVGAVITLFSDILQGGYGYNLFADKGYYFFGLGLPLPTFGGSAAGSSTPPAGSQ